MLEQKDLVMLFEAKRKIDIQIKETLSNALQKNQELELSQVTFFQFVSTLNFALVGLLFSKEQSGNNIFLWSSLVTGIIVFLVCVSYSRETVDKLRNENQETSDWILDHLDTASQKINESNTMGDVSIYINYANIKLLDIHKTKNKINEGENKNQNQIGYPGEIIVFFLYISFFSLVAYLLNENSSHFHFISYQTIALLIFAYLLSFKDWANVFLNNTLSLKLLK